MFHFIEKYWNLIQKYCRFTGILKLIFNCFSKQNFQNYYIWEFLLNIAILKTIYFETIYKFLK